MFNFKNSTCMKKITFLLVCLTIFTSTRAQIGDVFFPQFGQDAQWSVNDQFELEFTGTIAPAPLAGICTTFEDLVSDGIGNNDFTGLNMKFDAYIFDQPTNTTFIVGWNGLWSATEGLGLNLDFNQWLAQATTNYHYSAAHWVVPNPPTDYQAAVKKNTYNTFEIDIDASGVVRSKLNGYVCEPTYTAPMSVLKPTALSKFYVFFGCGYTGWKMKNFVVRKGDVTNVYFTDPGTGLSDNEQVTATLIPTSGKGVFNLESIHTGKEYSIVNTLGQQVQKGLITSNKQIINLTDVNSGTYMLIIPGEAVCKFILN